MRLPSGLFFVISFVAFPLWAEGVINSFEGGEAWIYADATDPTNAIEEASAPDWIVQCPPPPRGCFARSGFFVLVMDPDGVTSLQLDPHPEGTLALLIEDFAYELETVLTQPLSDAWLERLSHPAATMVVEASSATASEWPLKGFALAVTHLTSLNPALVQANATLQAEPSPLDALAETAETALNGTPRLIPDTKPQIEFAIRAQTDAFPDAE